MDIGIIDRTILKPIMHFYNDFFIFVFWNSYYYSSKLLIHNKHVQLYFFLVELAFLPNNERPSLNRSQFKPFLSLLFLWYQTMHLRNPRFLSHSLSDYEEVGLMFVLLCQIH